MKSVDRRIREGTENNKRKNGSGRRERDFTDKFSVRLSPGHHDEEVHDVPDVAQVGAAVEDEAESEDLEARLDAEDPEEIPLRGLELLCEYGLVVVRQMLLEGEDHAIGDDGEQDGVLEGRPLDDEARVLPYAIILRKDEQ